MDKENLEPGSRRSEDGGDQSKNERVEDQAIKMEDDFDGVLENVPSEDEEGQRCVVAMVMGMDCKVRGCDCCL